MNTATRHIIFYLLLVSFFSSCKKDNNYDGYSAAASPAIIASLNNIALAAGTLTDTLFIGRVTTYWPTGIAGHFDTIITGVKRMQVYAFDSLTQQSITFSLLDWRDSTYGNSFRSGSYSFIPSLGPCNRANQCVGATLVYDHYPYAEYFATGGFDLTSVDSVNGKVSAIFSGTIRDQTGHKLSISNGAFSNLSYVVVRF